MGKQRQLDTSNILKVYKDENGKEVVVLKPNEEYHEVAKRRKTKGKFFKKLKRL